MGIACLSLDEKRLRADAKVRSLSSTNFQVHFCFNDNAIFPIISKMHYFPIFRCTFVLMTCHFSNHFKDALLTSLQHGKRQKVCILKDTSHVETPAIWAWDAHQHDYEHDQITICLCGI